jgi:hypothetical protein
MADIPDRLDRESSLTRRMESVLRPIRGALYRGEGVEWDNAEAKLRDAVEDELIATFALMFFLLWSDEGPLRSRTSLTSYQGPTQDAVGLLAMGYGSRRAREISSSLIASGRDAQATWDGSVSPSGRGPVGAVPRGETGIEPGRVGSVATTETTAAGTAGEEAAARDAAKRVGIIIESYWRTERDSKVCPVCYPLDGKAEDVWRKYAPAGPPAHPNCRCHLIREVRD